MINSRFLTSIIAVVLLISTIGFVIAASAPVQSIQPVGDTPISVGTGKESSVISPGNPIANLVALPVKIIKEDLLGNTMTGVHTPKPKIVHQVLVVSDEGIEIASNDSVNDCAVQKGFIPIGSLTGECIYQDRENGRQLLIANEYSQTPLSTVYNKVTESVGSENGYFLSNQLFIGKVSDKVVELSINGESIPVFITTVERSAIPFGSVFLDPITGILTFHKSIRPLSSDSVVVSYWTREFSSPSGETLSLIPPTIIPTPVKLVPGIPKNFRATFISQNQIVVEWNPSNGTIDHYDVFIDGVQVSNTKVMNHSFAGLVNDTSYKLQVRSVSNDGKMSQFSTLNERTDGAVAFGSPGSGSSGTSGSTSPQQGVEESLEEIVEQQIDETVEELVETPVIVDETPIATTQVVSSSNPQVVVAQTVPTGFFGLNNSLLALLFGIGLIALFAGLYLRNQRK